MTQCSLCLRPISRRALNVEDLLNGAILRRGGRAGGPPAPLCDHFTSLPSRTARNSYLSSPVDYRQPGAGSRVGHGSRFWVIEGRAVEVDCSVWQDQNQVDVVGWVVTPIFAPSQTEFGLSGSRGYVHWYHHTLPLANLALTGESRDRVGGGKDGHIG